MIASLSKIIILTVELSQLREGNGTAILCRDKRTIAQKDTDGNGSCKETDGFRTEAKLSKRPSYHENKKCERTHANVEKRTERNPSGTEANCNGALTKMRMQSASCGPSPHDKKYGSFFVLFVFGRADN